jgi:hypothetical protein
MRRLLLGVVGVLAITVGILAPVASAHTVSISVDCTNGITINYNDFFFGTGGTSTESYTIDGGAAVVKPFFYPGPAQNFSDVIPLSLTGGTHTITVNVTNIKANPPDTFVVPDQTLTVQVTCSSPPPPAGVCTYTKGFYRNHADVTAGVIGAGTIPVGNANLTAAQAQDILNATPGKPGNVTFTSNDLLNLAQQVITAELNAARGSTPVPTAGIAAANAAFTVTISGGKIALSSSASNIGDLITPLDSFNSSDDCNS